MKHIFKLMFLPLLIFTTLMAEPSNTKTFKITDTNLLHWHHLRADAGTDKETKVGHSVHIVGNVHGIHYHHRRHVRYKWTLNNHVIARTAAFDYTPSKTGVDTLKLKVYYFCYSASDTMQVTVRTAIKPLKVDAGPTKNTHVGIPIKISASASNGTPPYSYKWTSNGQVLANTQHFTYPATKRGNYSLRLTVTDHAGVVASDNTSINVTGSTLAVNAGEDKTILEGSKITIIGSASGGSKPYRYKWKHNGVILAKTTSFEYNASLAGDYTLNFEVTDNTGTTKKDSMIVHVKKSTLHVYAGKDKTIIEGTDLNITGTVTGGTAPYKYEWSYKGKPFSKTLSFPYHDAQKGKHTFTFKVTDSVGTTKTDTMTLTVNPKPIPFKANAGKDKTTTLGRSIIIYGKATGGTSPYLYKWTLLGVPVSDRAIYRFKPKQAGKHTFTLTVTDKNHQKSTDTVIIHVIKPLAINAGKDQIVRIGIPVTLHAIATGGVKPYTTYKWSSNGSTVGTGESYTYTPDTLGRTIFTVQVTDTANNNKTDSVGVFVEKRSNLIVNAGQDQKTIVKKIVTLSATVKGGSQPYSYDWTIGGHSIGTTKTIQYIPTTVGTEIVTLTVTDKNNQKSTDTMTLTVNSIPFKVDTNASKKTIKVGQTTTLTSKVEGGTKPYTYEWTLDGETQGTKSTLKYKATTAGKKIFKLTVTDANQSTKSSTITIDVSEIPLPLKVTASTSKKTIKVGQTTTLTSKVEGGTKPYTYEWTLDGDIQGTKSTLNYKATTAGTKTFKLTVTDANQNTKSTNVIVNVSEVSLPLKVDANASKKTIEVGQTTTLTSKVEGGTKPYTYKWTLDGEIQGTKSTLNYKATTAGTKTFKLTVTDANQNTKSTNVTVTVTSGP